MVSEAVEGSNNGVSLSTDEMNVSGRPATRLSEEFDTDEELVDFLREGGSVTKFSWVGNQTSNRVFSWFEANYSDEYWKMLQNDEAYCTEYYTEDETGEGGEYLWGFVCPRCENDNPMEGNPENLRNRPMRCIKCNWVSCLHKIGIDKFINDD